ncbi:MAG: FtsX-like permease family protein [Nitrospirota bacterium]|jgi:putative ABC transport system permease protein
MKLLALAIKDISRRKAKSLYLLTAVVTPVIILSTILLTLDNADRSLSTLASKFGFTMIIQPKNIRVDRIDQIGVILDEYIAEESIPSIVEVIRSKLDDDADEEIIIAPRLYEKTDILREPGRTLLADSVVAGIDFEAELNARPSWKLTGGRWPENESETVIGGSYAKANGVSVGDRIEIKTLEFEAVGILEDYNSSEDYMLFMSYETAQNIFGKEGLTSLVNIQSVPLDRDKELLEAALGELNNNVPNIKALSPQQFSTMKYVLLKRTFRFLLSIAVATVAVSIFSIFNIVTTALYTRVREIGLLKSVGSSRSQLLKIFLYEYFIIGLVAGMVGYPLGLAMTYLLDSFLLKIGAAVRFSPQFLLVALLVGVLCSLTASFYPTYRLSGAKIIETFKTQWEV